MIWCGTSCKVISPQKPIELAGYAARWGKLSNGLIHDDLYAKALYLKSEVTSLLLISVDLCDLPGAQELQERLRKSTGVKHVLIAATHTHSGPYTESSIYMPDTFDSEWYEWFCDKLEETAHEAFRDVFPASIGAGKVDAPEVGKNRRPGCSITDPVLTLIKIEDEIGEVRALLVNYPCHCTILDGNSFYISADYPGYLYKILGKHYPKAEILFTNGAAGDINIGYSSDASALGERMNFRSFETAEMMGKILSEKLLRLMPEIKTKANCQLEAKLIHIVLPLRKNRPSTDELLKRIDKEDIEIQESSIPQEKRAACIRKIYLQSLIYSMSLVGEGETFTVPSFLLRIGSLVIVSSPAEMFCEIGMAIKQYIPLPFIGAIVGYAGGYVGYLPTQAALQAGGYEAEVSPFAENAANLFVQAVADSLHEII